MESHVVYTTVFAAIMLSRFQERSEEQSQKPNELPKKIQSSPSEKFRNLRHRSIEEQRGDSDFDCAFKDKKCNRYCNNQRIVRENNCYQNNKLQNNQLFQFEYNSNTVQERFERQESFERQEEFKFEKKLRGIHGNGFKFV